MSRKMDVPLDVKMRIQLKVEQAYVKAEQHYRVNLIRPTIVYEKVGTTAGTANYAGNRINLNSGLLMRNVEMFVNRTPVHEAGHLICGQIYPETRTKDDDSGKREIHGPKWQEVMTVIGATDIERTHKYDVSEVRKQNDRTLYDYKCPCCERKYRLTARRELLLLRGKRRYFCVDCGPEKGKLVKVGVLHHAPSPNSLKAPLKQPTAGTKLDMCWTLFKLYHPIPAYKKRSTMIALFVRDAGCTRAGAGTYYALCMKMMEAGLQ